MRGLKGQCPRCGAAIDVPGARKPRQRPTTPATERQKEFARELGIQFADGISKGDISTLIDEALASDARERGVDLDALEKREGDVYRDVRSEILAEIDEDDCRLSKATHAKIVEELGHRNLSAILITFPLDAEIDAGGPLECGFSYSDDLSRKDVQIVLVSLATGWKP